MLTKYIFRFQTSRILHRFHHDYITRKTFCITSPLCGNPPVTRWFPSQNASNIKFWCFLYYNLEQAVKQPVKLLVILQTITIIWHHCDEKILSSFHQRHSKGLPPSHTKNRIASPPKFCSQGTPRWPPHPLLAAVHPSRPATSSLHSMTDFQLILYLQCFLYSLIFHLDVFLKVSLIIISGSGSMPISQQETTVMTVNIIPQIQGVKSSPLCQNGRRFADDIFKCIFLNENVRISIQFSLKFVPKGPIDNKSALV